MGANWDAYNLPAIWSMLKSENACTGADRVLSWEGLAHDVRTQHRRLLDAKESLAAVWSPTQNASARIFLDRMSHLASSMNDTLTCAEDTRAGLRGVLEAISAAQMEVQPWVEVRQNATGDIIPRWADHAEDEYDEKARAAMRRAEAAIADHSTQIQSPPLYVPDPPRDGPVEILGEDDGGTTGAPRSGGETSGASGAGSVGVKPVPVAVPHDPPPADRFPHPSTAEPGMLPDTGAPGGISGGGGTGPDLAGVLPTPSTLPPAGGNGLIPPGAGALPGIGASVGPGIGGSGFLGVPPGVLPGGGVGSGGGMPVPIGGGSAQAGRQAVPVRTAMPSGAVIGSPSAGARPSGSGRASSPGLGRAGSVTSGMVGQPPVGNRGRGNTTLDESAEGKADQTWDVLDGVTPVIAPDTRPVRHDPGPGVLGFDR